MSHEHPLPFQYPSRKAGVPRLARPTVISHPKNPKQEEPPSIDPIGLFIDPTTMCRLWVRVDREPTNHITTRLTHQPREVEQPIRAPIPIWVLEVSQPLLELHPHCWPALFAPHRTCRDRDLAQSADAAATRRRSETPWRWVH